MTYFGLGPALNHGGPFEPGTWAAAGCAGEARLRGEWGAGWESVAGVVWVGSVLFCSCVCFGSVGRRLAVLEGGR